MVDGYSPTWFAVFMDTIESARTEREAAFLMRHMPLPTHRRVLDICCGTGRHVRPLAQRGHEVLGIDLHEGAIEKARAAYSHGGASFMQLDMRAIGTLPQPFDAATCLWQSFGQFDAETNLDVLRQIAGVLRPEGRFILDVYNREFFTSRCGVRVVERDGRRIIERKSMIGDRLGVELTYEDGATDRFDWQVFTPSEFQRAAGEAGFDPIMACAAFDERRAPSRDEPRMQFVLGRG